MAQLKTRRKRIGLMLLFATAVGCSSAALSGSLAVISYGAGQTIETPAHH